MATDQNGTTKKQNTTQDFGDIAKLLTGAVAIVIAATGTIGAASGGFANLLRNAGDRVAWSLWIAAIAAFIAGIATVWPRSGSNIWPKKTGKKIKWAELNWAWWVPAILFFSSAILLFISLWTLLNAQMSLQGTSARPVVATDWTAIGTNSVGLKVSAEADSISKNDVLTINVVGSNPKKEVQTFYKGSSGPDQDGKAKQQVTVTISAPAQFNMNAVFVVAAVLDRASEKPDTQVDCYGEVLKVDQYGRLHHTGQYVGATACMVLQTMPSPQSSATPK